MVYGSGYPIMVAPAPPVQMMNPTQFVMAKTHKSLKRISKCQNVSGYLLIALNSIFVLTNLFFLFTLNSWRQVNFRDDSGQQHEVKLAKTPLILMTLLKMVLHVLLAKWGCSTLKTFNPIAEELEKIEIYGQYNNETPKSHSI